MKTKDVPDLVIQAAENGLTVTVRSQPMNATKKSDVYVFGQINDLFAFVESYFVAMENEK